MLCGQGNPWHSVSMVARLVVAARLNEEVVHIHCPHSRLWVSCRSLWAQPLRVQLDEADAGSSVRSVACTAEDAVSILSPCQKYHTDRIRETGVSIK